MKYLVEYFDEYCVFSEELCCGTLEVSSTDHNERAYNGIYKRLQNSSDPFSVVYEKDGIFVSWYPSVTGWAVSRTVVRYEG